MHARLPHTEALIRRMNDRLRLSALRIGFLACTKGGLPSKWWGGKPAPSGGRAESLRRGTSGRMPGRVFRFLLDACKRNSPGKAKQEVKAGTENSLTTKHDARSSAKQQRPPSLPCS